MPRSDLRQRAFARSLRQDMTAAEQILWRELRGSRLEGAKFRRQVPLGPDVVDFLCFAARLIVELGGPPHADPDQQRHDRIRDAWLRSQAFRVLRFPNDILLGGSGELVLREIRRALADPSSDPR